MLTSIVICNGVIRSGSTWSFNVCRLLETLRAKRRGEPFLSDYIHEPQLEEFLRSHVFLQQGSIVYKAHITGPLAIEWIRTGKARSVSTFRDPRDCVASNMAFSGEDFDTSVQLVVACLKTLLASMDFGRTLFVRYEDMMSDRLGQIQLIAAYLNVRIDQKELESIDEQTNINSSRKISDQVNTLGDDQAQNLPGIRRRHRTTLLHDHHIGSAQVGRWKKDLTEAQGQQLTHLFQKVLLTLGYETRESIQPYLLNTAPTA